MTAPVLVLVDTPTCAFSVVEESARLASTSLQDVCVATHSGLLAADSAPVPGPYRCVVATANTAGHHTPALLGWVCKALAPGGSLIVREPAESNGNLLIEQVLKRNLLLAGFASTTATASGTTLQVTANKPAWETGAKAAISLKHKAGTSTGNGTAAAGGGGAATWAVAAAVGDDDEELIDDDELLTEEDRVRPAAKTGADGCDVGAARKACKNCSCGRAEAEAAAEAGGVKLSAEALDNPQSACGSCGLGDAFRCATCPYKGLPPFAAGSKVQLSSDFLTADV